MIEQFEDDTDVQRGYRYYFLFSFYTMGMNMADMGRLRKRNIKNDILIFKRSKTGRTYEIHLLEAKK